MRVRLPISIPTPQLQIDFAYALAKARSLYLREALSETVERLGVQEIDLELASIVPREHLSAVASHGLRGELVFSVPCVLAGNPRLLAYYRLLLGFSQKAFYSRETGASPFKSMEDSGALTESNRTRLHGLCEGLIGSACELLNGIGVRRVSRELLDDLTLLTLGPQLRGGANVRAGMVGIGKVFEVIHGIVQGSAVASGPSRIEVLNAAGRRVLIEVAPDPDIVIREEMAEGSFRNAIALEVKAGTDFSNIHNRIGEAEKSHQKARNVGFVECWTVVNVDRIDIGTAQQESPSTNRFYRLSHLEAREGDEFEDFRQRVVALTGIPGR